MQGIGEQPLDVVPQERREHDLPHLSTGSPDPRQHPRERVRGTDLVVAISTDQEQVAHVRVEQEMLDQIEGRGIQPLQVIQEQRERVLRACKHAEKTPEDQLEATLPFLLRELRNRRLLADDEGQLRDEIDHELAVRSKRIEQGGAPLAHLRVALAEDLSDEALEGLSQRRIRNIALVLVELSRCEQAARRNQHLVQLVDDRGLADPGISGDEHQLRPAALDDAVERGEQGVDLARPAVQFFWDQEPVRGVVLPEREFVDPAPGLPFSEAAPQIALDAGRRLVALLGDLGEQLHDDCRDGGLDILQPLDGGHRHPRDVAVHPLHGIGSREGKAAGEHLIESDAE